MKLYHLSHNGLAMGLAALGALASCSPLGPPKPPVSTQNPPIYPGAQQETVQRSTIPAMRGQLPGQLITFSTLDTPEEVLTFYEDTLTNDDWTVSSSSSGLKFYWMYDCPVYYLDVTAKSEGSGTSVLLRLSEELCL